MKYKKVVRLYSNSRVAKYYRATHVVVRFDDVRYNWQESRPSTLTALLGAEADNIDLFDRMQLEHVIAICRQAKSLSAAGRELFDISRQGKASVNDADRLRKYLARFGLTWEAMQDQHSSS